MGDDPKDVSTEFGHCQNIRWNNNYRMKYDRNRHDNGERRIFRQNDCSSRKKSWDRQRSSKNTFRREWVSQGKKRNVNTFNNSKRKENLKNSDQLGSKKQNDEDLSN